MIKLGVIGFGRRAGGLINGTFRKTVPDMRITGIIDPDEKGVRSRLLEEDREHVVFYGSVDDLIRKGKVDAVMVGSLCNTHAAYALQLACYDIPLFLEKPVATTMKQAMALEKAFRKSKCHVMVSFPLRVSPLCRMVRQMIKNGAVGRPEHILAFNYVNYGHGYFDHPSWNYAITGGLFLQKATHDFDAMMYVMDSPIVRVAAMQSCGRIFGGNKPSGLRCSTCSGTETCPESPRNRARNQSSGRLTDHICLFSRDHGSSENGMDEDSSSALVEFASGAQGVYTQVFFSRRDASARGAIISGYNGTVNFDWYKNEIHRVRHHEPFSDTIKADAGLGHFGGDQNLADGFLDLVKGKKITFPTIWEGLRSVYACLAAKESAKQQKFVFVRQAKR